MIYKQFQDLSLSRLGMGGSLADGASECDDDPQRHDDYGTDPG